MSTEPTTTPNDPGLERSASTCPSCSATLAADQRYCLNCGHRLTEPRVDYQRALGLAPQSPAPMPAPVRGRDTRAR
jgi:predicted amidophosphoribosyltransferase